MKIDMYTSSELLQCSLKYKDVKRPLTGHPPMTHATRFDLLPNEMYHLIHENLFDDRIQTLLSLVLVSKHCYAVFNSYLYKIADDSMLDTLGLSQDDRLPLTIPHPASFVRELDLILETSNEEAEKEGAKVDDVSEEGDVQRQVTSTLENVMANASSPLRRFGFRADRLTLSEAFGNMNNISIFGSLEELTVGCPFPAGNTLQRSFDIFVGFL
jgi:hypothetical protein